MYSQINGEYDLVYVDFTGSPDDAKLNVSQRGFVCFQLHADGYFFVTLLRNYTRTVQCYAWSISPKMNCKRERRSHF